MLQVYYRQYKLASKYNHKKRDFYFCRFYIQQVLYFSPFPLSYNIHWIFTCYVHYSFSIDLKKERKYSEQVYCKKSKKKKIHIPRYNNKENNNNVWKSLTILFMLHMYKKALKLQIHLCRHCVSCVCFSSTVNLRKFPCMPITSQLPAPSPNIQVKVLIVHLFLPKFPNKLWDLRTRAEPAVLSGYDSQALSHTSWVSDSHWPV